MSRDLRLVTISLFGWGLGEGLFLYFQTIYLQKWGADPVAIGAILGALGVAMAISQTPFGYLADRIGPRPLMWISWIMGAVATWIQALAVNLNMFVAGMLLYGLTAAVLAPMNAYITAVRGKWSAGRALTLTSAAYHFGMVIGPTIGGFVGEQYGLKMVYSIAATFFVISTIIVLLVRKPPAEIHLEEQHKLSLRQNPHFLTLLALTFLTMLVLYFPQPLTPNFLQNQRGFTLQEVGFAGTLGSLGIVTLSLLLGHVQPSIAFLIGQPLVAIFSLIMWRGTGMAVIGIGYFFIGGYRLARSMVLAFARSMIHSNETGLAYGLLETSNALAAILAPPIAGLLYERNPSSIYPAAMVAIAVVLVINLILLPRLTRQSHPLRFSSFYSGDSHGT